MIFSFSKTSRRAWTLAVIKLNLAVGWENRLRGQTFRAST